MTDFTIVDKYVEGEGKREVKKKLPPISQGKYFVWFSIHSGCH